jgi:hypothetical protein
MFCHGPLLFRIRQGKSNSDVSGSEDLIWVFLAGNPHLKVLRSRSLRDDKQKSKGKSAGF